MKTSSTKSLLIFFSLISLVFLAVLVFGVYYIKTKNSRTLEILSEVDLASNNALLIQTIRPSGNASSSSEISELNGITLTKDKFVGFIENIEQMGKDLGLKVKIISVSSDENKSGPQKITMQIETTGDWKQSIKFIHLIENLPFRTIINSSDLTVDSSAESINSTGTSTSARGKIWKSGLSLSFYSFD